MAKRRASVCRLCRRANMKLFLKGDRCYTEKCAIDRRPYPPGMHVEGRRRKPTEYAVQLREKQKSKWFYGLAERQFRNLFGKASRRKGPTGENFLLMLERRLDNVVYRMGFARSLAEARQLVNHGHIFVDGHAVTSPSYCVSPGEAVVIREKSRTLSSIAQALETVSRRGIPPWMEVDPQNFKGVIKALPARADVRLPVEEQFIVEFYSKV